MHSARFDLPVVLTSHAKLRMVERDMNAALVLEIIDTGIIKDAGNTHYWRYKHFNDRGDNTIGSPSHEKHLF